MKRDLSSNIIVITSLSLMGLLTGCSAVAPMAEVPEVNVTTPAVEVVEVVEMPEDIDTVVEVEVEEEVSNIEAEFAGTYFVQPDTGAILYSTTTVSEDTILGVYEQGTSVEVSGRYVGTSLFEVIDTETEDGVPVILGYMQS